MLSADKTPPALDRPLGDVLHEVSDGEENHENRGDQEKKEDLDMLEVLKVADVTQSDTESFRIHTSKPKLCRLDERDSMQAATLSTHACGTLSILRVGPTLKTTNTLYLSLFPLLWHWQFWGSNAITVDTRSDVLTSSGLPLVPLIVWSRTSGIVKSFSCKICNMIAD